MSLISILITLVIVCIMLWLINTYIPMDGKIKKIINAVVVIIVILWLVSASGVVGSLSHMRIGR
ncbi:MAG: Thivi_2564 family membrane protein [Chitinispirillaceae bacterium]